MVVRIHCAAMLRESCSCQIEPTEPLCPMAISGSHARAETGVNPHAVGIDNDLENIAVELDLMQTTEHSNRQPVPLQEETAMTERHNEHHPNDRKPISTEDPCEVAHVARKLHLTMPEARMLLRQYGSNHTRLEREARKLIYQPR